MLVGIFHEYIYLSVKVQMAVYSQVVFART